MSFLLAMRGGGGEGDREREGERESRNEITKSVAVLEGSQWNTLVFSGPTKILNYHQTRNESKESNFHLIIKPLSFMTPSRRKLQSLCLSLSVGCSKKKNTRGEET